MKSLLFQKDQTPFIEPSGCGAVPCRTEVDVTIHKEGRAYTYVLRDKVAPEDAYLPQVKAIAFAIQMQEPFAGTPTPKSIKDYLLKQNVIV